MDLKLIDNGGVASLPVMNDNKVWWKLWGPRIAAEHGRAGWILFLLDVNDRIQEVSMLLSRVLRNKPGWGEGWSEKEWLNVAEQAAEAKGWFETHAPGPMKDAPEWAQFIFVSQYGNLGVLARACRELRAVQEQGYLVATLERKESSIALNDAASEILLGEAD